MRIVRSTLTLAAQEAFTAVTVLVGFVATPLLLRWLGDVRLGAYEAASSWYGYAALFEFGITGALYPLLSRSIASDDRSTTYQTLVAGMRAYAVSAAFMILAGTFLACLMTKLVPVGRALASDLQTGAWIAIPAFALLPFSTFRTLAEAAQRAYLVSGLLIVQSFIITGLSLFLAWVGWGITGQFLATLIGAVVFSMALVMPGVRRFPGVVARAFTGPVDSETSRALRRLKWPTFVFNVCGRLSIYTDNILVAWLIAPAAVVPFFVTQRLAALVQGELQGIGNATWAGMTELYHSGRHDDFNHRLVELSRFIAILAVAGLVPIVVFNSRFIALWVGRSRYGGTAVTALAAINAALQAIFSLWGWCIGGLGEIRRIMPGMVAHTIINVACSVVFTFMFGIVGPLLGTTVAFAGITSWYLPSLLKNLFGTDIKELIKAIVIPAASAAPYLLAVKWLETQHVSHGWIGMGLEMSICASLYLAACWTILLTGEDRALWRQRVRLIVQPGGQ